MLLIVPACDLPRDPHKTLARVQGRTLKAGVSEDPPFIVQRGIEAEGIEADVIRGFAKQLGADVRWIWGSQERQLEALHEFDLDLVAGGLRANTPWKKKVAVTRPFLETLKGDQHVFAVPAGENAFLEELEKYLASHHDEIAHAAGEKP